MQRTEVTITSDTNPEAKMHLLLDEAGDIHVGLQGAITVKFKGSKLNKEIHQNLLDIIQTTEEDVPIGKTITVEGQQYTCKEAPDDSWGIEPCDICALRYRKDICMKYAFRCIDEERADNTNIIFE